MIVAVDARHLAGGRGVAHYTSALLQALASSHPDDEYRAFVPRADSTSVWHRLPSRVVFGSAALTGRPRLDRLAGGADVVWIPAPAPVAITRGVPYVLTVHDLSWIERPQDFTPYERLWHRLGRMDRLARQAAAVVCVSAATRDLAVVEWDLDPATTHVIHSGVTAPAESRGERGGATPPYFLAVGALEPRKAPDVLARAHAIARREGLEAELVFAGDGRLADAVRGDGVRVLGRVEDLGALYRDATALVMPSYLEGFGFPPLEAALAGTPSIVSDLPVFDETLGDAALKFGPGDERALADALLRLERDDALRLQLAQQAHDRARKLTWDETARHFHEVLRSVA